MYKRSLYQKVIKRIEGPRGFMQVLAGPRQVGKSTLAHQISQSLFFPFHYASADDSAAYGSTWIKQHWEIGRQSAQSNHDKGALLILDEIQKISNWSETVKKLWDEDTLQKTNLKVMLLGSATLLIQTGLGKSRW